MKNKKSFILYADYRETFRKLSDEQAGQLIKHIFDYVNGEQPKIKDFVLDIAFTPIKTQLERDFVKWDEIVEKRRLAGKKGGMISGETRSKKKQNEANEANAYFAKQNEAKGSKRKQNEANEADNVNDTVNDIVNDTVNDNVINKNIPTFLEFKNFALSNEPNLKTKSIELKYKAWKENDWKDGNDKKIKNWKTKLLNTIPHLQTKNNLKAGLTADTKRISYDTDY